MEALDQTDIPSQNDGSNDDIDRNIVSSEFEALVSLIAVCILTTLFGGLGVCTNILHLAVYRHTRQGTNDDSSAFLTALAFSDMWISLMHVFIGLCFLFEYLEIEAYRVNWMHVMDLAFAWPRAMMVSISTTITAFVSAERAICVIWPLKVRSIVTRKRSIVAVVVICLAMFLLFSPVFFSAGLSWQEIQITDSNTTSTISKLQMWRGPQRDIIEIRVNIAIIIYLFICYALCITFTIIMTKGLYKASRFRGGSVARDFTNMSQTSSTPVESQRNSSTRQTGLSTRDRKAICTVSMVTVMYIVCTFPNILAITWRFVDPDIITGGSQENLLWVLFSFVYLAESICASCNIFIYVCMSTKYRQTLFLLFTCGRKNIVQTIEVSQSRANGTLSE